MDKNNLKWSLNKYKINFNKLILIKIIENELVKQNNKRRKIKYLHEVK